MAGGSGVRVDLALQTGMITEEVTVSAEARLLETDSSDRGQVINRQQIVNLPLNGRAYAARRTTRTITSTSRP